MLGQSLTSEKGLGMKHLFSVSDVNFFMSIIKWECSASAPTNVHHTSSPL